MKPSQTDNSALSLPSNKRRRFKRTLPAVRGVWLFLQVWAFLFCGLFPSAAFSQAPLFTFAQISDSQANDALEQARFEAVLDTIVASGQPGALIPHRVSFVMFGGDLVDSPSSLIEWTTFLNTVNTRLTANGIPYRAVPGNHDRNSKVGFTNYEAYIASSGVWETGSNVVTGHNGLMATTGWNGLDFIGLNNSNGGYNVVSYTDLALVDQLASQASSRNENIFLLAHHPHNENSTIPLIQTLNNPDVLGYMHGHSGSTRVTLGLAGVQNPNIWDLNSQDIATRGAILYYEVYSSQIVVFPIRLDQSSTVLPSSKSIALVYPMVPAGPPEAPTADFTASPLSGAAPLTVTFTDQSAGLPTSWVWDFGDGSGSTVPNPTHQYTTAGLKTVTLVATNSVGSNQLIRSNYIDVSEPLPQATFFPVADSKVNFSSASRNYGTENNLRVRGGSTPWNSYLKFNVAGLSGSVDSATLRLYVNDGSKDGGTLFGVPDTSWSESGITYANAPAFGAALGNAGVTSVGQWIEFDVTSVISGAGPVSFGLSSSSTDSGYVDSREGAFPPELVVTLAGDPAPDVTVSPSSYNYGSLAVGQGASQTFIIRNDGSADLSVTGLSLAGPDSADFGLAGPSSFALVPGTSQNVQVTFTPSSAGSKSASLFIASDDPDESLVEVNLGGTGTTLPTASISLKEVKTGGSSAIASVSTDAALSAVDGDVYLASISSKGFQTVSAVNGLGLAWTKLRGQCSGRNQTGVSIWTATGTPSASSGVVTAVLAGSPSNAVIAVARYSGVGSVGSLVSANTNGVSGACSGGLDSSSYAASLPTTGANSLVLAAVAMRGVSHTAGGGFVEQVFVAQGTSSGSRASEVVLDRVFDTAGIVTVEGLFSGSVDWALAAVELKP